MTPTTLTAADLARIGERMIRAQQRYFLARRTRPHSLCQEELDAAKAVEAEFARACKVALKAERACLPGMEGGGS